MIAWTTEEITLAMYPTMRPRQVLAEVYCGLAYHSPLEAGVPGFIITHVATGCAVCDARTEAGARAIIESLTSFEGMDWTQPEAGLRRQLGEGANGAVFWRNEMWRRARRAETAAEVAS